MDVALPRSLDEQRKQAFEAYEHVGGLFFLATKSESGFRTHCEDYVRTQIRMAVCVGADEPRIDA
jgi:hypothetical protein